MYNDYINEKTLEKIDYDISLLKDYVEMYTYLLIKYPNESDLRKKLTKFIKEYFNYSFKEYKILYKIKKINDINREEEIIEVLEQLENLFKINYNIVESVFLDYENISYDDIKTNILGNRKIDINNIESISKRLIKSL